MDMKTETKYDIICLSETWLKDGQHESIYIQNFIFASSFSRKKKMGGGVAIYVRENTPWTFIRRPDIESAGVQSTFEVSGIEIKGENPTIIVVLYRSPEERNLDSFFKKLHALLTHLAKENKALAVCADLNIDYLRKNKKMTQLEDILLEFNLKAHIRSPTRVTASTSTAIDNILTNFNREHEPKIEKTGLSDHFGLTFSLQAHDNKKEWEEPRISKKRTITGDKLNNFAREMEFQDWTAVRLGTTVDEKYEAFQKIFNKHVNNHFPKKAIKIDTRNKYQERKFKITPQIVEAIKKKTAFISPELQKKWK